MWRALIMMPRINAVRSHSRVGNVHAVSILSSIISNPLEQIYSSSALTPWSSSARNTSQPNNNTILFNSVMSVATCYRVSRCWADGCFASHTVSLRRTWCNDINTGWLEVPCLSVSKHGWPTAGDPCLLTHGALLRSPVATGSDPWQHIHTEEISGKCLDSWSCSNFLIKN